MQQNSLANIGQQRSSMNSAVEEIKRKTAAVYGLAKTCGFRMDDDVLKIWFMALEDFSAEQVERGIALAIKTEEYSKMPVPAKIIRKIREACGIPSPLDRQKAKEAQAEAEWEQVNDQVRRVGSYGNPRFHPTTERVIRSMGGWGAVCAWETASKEWKHKDFVRLWQDFHEVGDAMELGAFGVQQALEERMGQRPAELPHGWLKRIQ